jgi:hypothetical protein
MKYICIKDYDDGDVPKGAVGEFVRDLSYPRVLCFLNNCRGNRQADYDLETVMPYYHYAWNVYKRSIDEYFTPLIEDNV